MPVASELRCHYSQFFIKGQERSLDSETEGFQVIIKIGELIRKGIDSASVVLEDLGASGENYSRTLDTCVQIFRYYLDLIYRGELAVVKIVSDPECRNAILIVNRSQSHAAA